MFEFVVGQLVGDGLAIVWQLVLALFYTHMKNTSLRRYFMLPSNTAQRFINIAVLLGSQKPGKTIVQQLLSYTRAKPYEVTNPLAKGKPKPIA